MLGVSMGMLLAIRTILHIAEAAEAEGMRLRNESYFTAVRTIKLP